MIVPFIFCFLAVVYLGSAVFMTDHFIGLAIASYKLQLYGYVLLVLAMCLVPAVNTIAAVALYRQTWSK